MSQMCPNCSHNNTSQHPSGLCHNCGAVLRGLLGFGTHVKDYEVQQVLSCGGFGAVYKAKDLKHNRSVAIKEMFHLDDKDLKRFEHEATILSRLSHPQLPRFYDHFEHQGKRYLVMEFIQGQSLAEIVIAKKERGEKIREVVALGWALQLSDAVAYLHKEAIIHRDIKPDNVRLTPSGEICLVDFGIAKKTSRSTASVTIVHGLTPGYAPIEQYARGGTKYHERTDERTDIYACGATLYTIVTNLIPPDARSLKARIDVIPPIQAIHPQLSDQFAMTIERAMELTPEDRFASVAEMRQALLGKIPPYPEPETNSPPLPAPPPPASSPKITAPEAPPKRTEGPSFTFSDGRQAHNLRQFIGLCEDLWEEAKIHLYAGFIEQWGWLPIHGMAGLVVKAREIREKEANRDLGLDTWLEMAARTAKVQRQPAQITLSVTPFPPMDFGQIQDWDAERQPIQLQLKLHGSRTRRSIVGCAPCLEVNLSEIAWAPNNLARLGVRLKTGAALPAGEHLIPEAVWLETDHQKQTIAARIVVQPRAKIEVQPTSLNFGKVDPKDPPTHLITIRHSGKENWQGSIQTVPWLKVSSQQIKCNAGDEVSIEVTIPQKTLTQPRDYQEQSAITIRVGEQLCSVAAQLTVLQGPRVIVSPEVLDFGEVDSIRCPKRQLELHYTGKTDWQGSIQPKVPWLEIQGVTTFHRQQKITQVTIAAKPDTLPTPGVYKKKEAITISGKDQTVTVAAQLVAREPSVKLSRALLDFGVVTDIQTIKLESIEVYNPSLFEWQGTARSTVPWLKVEPSHIVCSASKRLMLHASLTLLSNKLKGGLHQQSDAILIEGMGQSLSVGVQLTRPQQKDELEINPNNIDFGKITNISQAKPQRIELRHTGTKDLRLNLDPILSWIDIQPRFVECPAGGHAEIKVFLSQMAHHLPPSHYSRPKAISITGAGELRHIGVDIEIVKSESKPKGTSNRKANTLPLSDISKPKPHTPPDHKTHTLPLSDIFKPKPQPAPSHKTDTLPRTSASKPKSEVEVTPLTIDFGQISNLANQEKELEVINHTQQDWTGWVIFKHDWLERSPVLIQCAPGSKAVIPVRLSPAFTRMAAGTYDRPKAIIIRGQDGKTFHIRVHLQKVKP